MLKWLWMTPVIIFKSINPIKWMAIDIILAHFLTFCLYYVIIRVIITLFKRR